jgi:hypothetical protein
LLEWGKQRVFGGAAFRTLTTANGALSFHSAYARLFFHSVVCAHAGKSLGLLKRKNFVD